MSPTNLEPPGGHGTAEQPVVLDGRLRVGWPVLTVLVGLAALGTGGLSQATSADAKATANRDALHAHELRIQRVEDAQAATADALREIKAELKEINRKLDERRKP
mgnify:CR=1 FL=1